ncbi:MAG: glycosyltransferase family 4 protein [Methanobacteriaceae archaeon]|nr:glycosyltransferase family 4 protein [Methanobacteriaceae archaeon]
MEKLKIAQVAPVMVEIPPQKYGGIESIVTDLTLEMAKRGHAVTVFGAGNSKIHGTNIEFVACSPFPTTKDLSQNRKYELAQLELITKRQKEFNLIHFHYEPLMGRTDSNDYQKNLFAQISTPKIHTFHNTTWIDQNIDYYRRNKEKLDGHYVFISHDQEKALQFINHKTVIYNGIHQELYRFNPNPKDFLLFAGRLTKVKGIEEAIQVSKITNNKLMIFGKVDSTDLKYFESQIKPLIDGTQIVYLGEVGTEKYDYFRDAKALIFPISWHEPFGLVMVEAMASGTPVLAFRSGSVEEVVADGKSGFVVSTVSEMAEKIDQLDQVDRYQCRAWVEKNFTVKRMVENYEKLYLKIANLNNFTYE